MFVGFYLGDGDAAHRRPLAGAGVREGAGKGGAAEDPHPRPAARLRQHADSGRRIAGLYPGPAGPPQHQGYGGYLRASRPGGEQGSRGQTGR